MGRLGRLEPGWADFELRVPESRRKLAAPSAGQPVSRSAVKAEVVNTLSASAPGGASIIFGKANGTGVVQKNEAFPFEHSSMGAFLQSCRGAKISVTLHEKGPSRTGTLLMVEKARRVLEGSKDQTEEYFSMLQLFEEHGSIRKIPFRDVAEVSLVDPLMQEQLGKCLEAALASQMPKPLPPPKDSREVISIRAKASELAPDECRVSYVEAWCPQRPVRSSEEALERGPTRSLSEMHHDPPFPRPRLMLCPVFFFLSFA